jgi:hypothetical protein
MISVLLNVKKCTCCIEKSKNLGFIQFLVLTKTKIIIENVYLTGLVHIIFYLYIENKFNLFVFQDNFR